MRRRFFLLVLLLGACKRDDSEIRPAPAASTASATAARGVRVVRASAGSNAADVIQKAAAAEKASGRTLVVYVGAKWCEPCQRLHQAAERGELDTQFPGLTLLEFDLDVDRDALVAAGYEGNLIPLFVVPDPSGRATGRRFEGSIKGDGAVANITPRLRALLAN